MANKYNAEGYYSPTEYEALTNIEKEERAAQIAANSDRLFTYAHPTPAM